MTSISRPKRWPLLLTTLLMAAVGTLILLPGLRSAAQDPLGVFRVKRFAAVTLDPTRLPPRPGDPTSLGSLTISQSPTRYPAASLAEAQAQVDFPLRTPRTVPQGWGPDPQIQVSREGRFSYTLDLQRVRSYLASLGATSIDLPANLDGATLELTIPAHVVAEYRGEGASLVLGQGKSPVLQAPPGLDVELIRQQVLSLPGLPPELVSQVQAVEDWRHTAIVPIPKDQASSQEVAVDGVKGLLLEGSKANERALLWQKNDVLYGLAGKLPAAELLAIANSLQ